MVAKVTEVTELEYRNGVLEVAESSIPDPKSLQEMALQALVLFAP